MSTDAVQPLVPGRERSLHRKIWVAIKAYRVRRQRYLAARALAGLSDYMLKDMGIARSEIHALVHDRSTHERCRGHEDAAA